MENLMVQVVLMKINLKKSNIWIKKGLLYTSSLFVKVDITVLEVKTGALFSTNNQCRHANESSNIEHGYSDAFMHLCQSHYRRLDLSKFLVSF
jgi:hypothetical protein